MPFAPSSVLAPGFDTCARQSHRDFGSEPRFAVPPILGDGRVALDALAEEVVHRLRLVENCPALICKMQNQN